MNVNVRILINLVINTLRTDDWPTFCKWLHQNNFKDDTFFICTETFLMDRRWIGHKLLNMMIILSAYAICIIFRWIEQCIIFVKWCLVTIMSIFMFVFTCILSTFHGEVKSDDYKLQQLITHVTGGVRHDAFSVKVKAFLGWIIVISTW